MVQKIIAAAFALLMVGAIVMGVVALAQGPEEEHSTLECGSEQHTADVAQVDGGQGQGQGLNSTSTGQGQGLNGTNTGQGQGQYGAGTGDGQAEVQIATPPEDWRSIAGTVVALNDLVVELADGTSVQVGLGPETYREAQGFVLELGQRVAISGYDEDGEFKAGTLENLDTGDSIVLRTADGRPMWAGQGKGKNRS